MKYEAYKQVYSYTGYELDKLEEKNGTYYTESGAVSYTHLDRPPVITNREHIDY